MCPNLDISLVNLTIYAGYCIFACGIQYESFWNTHMGFVLYWHVLFLFLFSMQVKFTSARKNNSAKYYCVQKKIKYNLNSKQSP